MNKKELRIAEMKRLLSEKGFMHIRDVAAALDVSEMTVRRDIAAQEKDGVLVNLNGILMSAAGDPTRAIFHQYELADDAQVQNEAKTALGRYAASLIEPEDSVFFDAGSTVEQIARFVDPALQFDAFCCTLNTLLCLINCPRATVGIPGGYYYPNLQLLLSEEGIRFIRSIRVRKLFLSAAGIHEEFGISCANGYEVSVKKAILRSAERHILVADSSKFGVIRSAYFCDMEDIHEIITDDRLPAEWVERIRKRNIVLHQVSLPAGGNG